ncbi:MAG: TolC family protein [Gammaproteobacteria bacterium]|nr:TolC family protein [Gammaproteobacteria bacterium]
MPGPTARRSAAYCLVLLSSTAITGIGVASDLAANKRTISLHEAVIKTIEHNPDLQAFDYRLKVQQGRVQQAGLAPSPELSLQLEDVLGTGNNKGVDSAEATLSIGWILERGVRRHYVDAARAGSVLIEVETDIKQLDAAAETARRYLVSLAYQAREANADKTIQLAQETIRAVRIRVKAGKTPEAELFRAQAELARRKLQREDIEHELLSANRRLAAQWGETTLTFARVEGDITNLIQVASFETLKSQLPQNPEFARLLSDRLLKKAELQLALAQNRPNWRVNAGIRHTNNGNDQAFVAGISIPFGERTRNPGRIAEARANLAKTNSEEQAARIRIETALFVMHEKLQHSLHIIGTVRGEVIPPLEQALTDTRRAYKLGRYSYLELRSVQAELLDAHNALVEASIDAHRNIIEIERLTGVRIAQAVSPLKGQTHEVANE